MFTVLTLITELNSVLAHVKAATLAGLENFQRLIYLAVLL